MEDRAQAMITELADHLEGMARSLRRFAEEDDPGPSAAAPETQPSSHQSPAAAQPFDQEEAVAKARGIHPLLGSHQELVIRKLAVAHPRGLSASQINENSSTLPNTYLTLDKLAEMRLVRRDDQVHPRRYFFGPCMLD